ncbi:HD domain-containing phosphohydrolase [Pseudomonas benzenivorans]|uniref:HD domain-containing protein n=1 Tax=Pseudomonas benzenivorans TaxID=556533 RepID=A0ABY5H541_9PSED|nr:HD domain-containing phosphohydrolase [Pseudomonas benzenivorans]UTW07425.1 HD domain-containing protein [Pseudomonas benzenivorans]
MPSRFWPRDRRFPLHVHISLLFTLLLLLTGTVLGVFNHRQTTQIIFDSSARLFTQIQQNVQLDLEHTYQPIRQLLSLLALNEASQAGDLQGRLALLKPFAQALRDNPKMASLYLGYEDGDFFMVRPLRDEAIKLRFSAPDNAAFQVWSIDRSAAGVEAAYLFFDGSLNLLSRSPRLDEDYDPRSRPWYRRARVDGGQITTKPYVFFSTAEVGTTLARRSGLTTVLAADLTLAELSAALTDRQITASSQVVLYDPAGNAVAYPDSARLMMMMDGEAMLSPARELSPEIDALLANDTGELQQSVLELRGRRWVVSRSRLVEGGPQGLFLALLVPEDELLADAYRLRWQGALITLATLLLCLPLGWLTSRLVVKPLKSLVDEAEAIRRFDFQYPASGHSPVLEVDQLAVSMTQMKETIASFLEIAASLSAVTRFDILLERVLEETVGISQAQGGLIYLVDAEHGRLEPQGLFLDGTRRSLGQHHIPGYDNATDALPEWLRGPAGGGPSAVVSLGFDQAGDYRSLLSTLDSPRVHLVATGLHNRQGDTVGILVLLHCDSGEPRELALLRRERVAFVEAVSGVAALCIESQRLLLRQKKLLDAIIQLIAGAIDAKSPYTGGHCQRVPEITLMLARAAADSDDPAFQHYQPSVEEWEALHIAAWLHDCGKVTTPEYVVDKATKLETLYDRIHEVRMRFEVLKRDAWIAYWRGCAEGGEPNALGELRDSLLASLDEEFAFVAACNLGGESMAEADQERLRQIASRTWTRTLDDRLGVSWEEAQRLQRRPPASLPVEEPLLADKPEHLLERPADELIPADNPWGFQLEVPQYKFNRGELHNLSVGRGTLTTEERYIINHHIVQTILMLDRLPFPPHLQNVAEMAGGHHEKMDGSGYPKRLRREQMSLPARMMAIADIFEALTAVDRPYKKGKLLSESLNLMAEMCRTAHIDPQLFGLFVRARVYREYAERFMQQAQIDAVDEAAVLAKAGLESGEAGG